MTAVEGGAVAAWLAGRRVTEAGRTRPIDLRDSREWLIEDGALVHRDGGYFAVRGARVEGRGSVWDALHLPIIDQPEVGLLGFVVAPGPDGAMWLLQAKSEPGSVGWVQVGPTVQATRSNYARRHGGAPTRFLGCFRRPDGTVRGSDHSEQGSRFLGKMNRNATVGAPEPFDPGHPNWRWFASAPLREALAGDFRVNTDSRSVIATGDWSLLRKGPLFEGDSWAGAALAPLRALLARGMAAPDEGGDPPGLARAVAAAPATRLSLCPFPGLPGWRWTGGRLEPCGAMTLAGGVGLLAVEAPGREVPSWDQPFLLPSGEQRACLALALRGGFVAAALRPVAEPGFRGRVELGPTWQSDGDAPAAAGEVLADRAPTLAVLQSDEGGRFLKAVTRYEVHLIDEAEAAALGPGVAWTTLPAVARLCRTPGRTTNEARSLMSLLLSLA